MNKKTQILDAALSKGQSTLTEHESKMFLKAYGIPVTREVEVLERGDLDAALENIGFPLVMKACSPLLSHKTEKGLVRTDIRNQEEATAAFEELLTGMEESEGSILVQEMVHGERELMVGMTRDPQFGPCVLFGLGGIFTEVLEDVSFRVAPVEKKDVLEMMQDIRARKILGDIRGLPAADLDSLADMIIAIGEIGLENDIIQEIDLNPVILSGTHPIAVDALIVLNSDKGVADKPTRGGQADPSSVAGYCGGRAS
ncbi:MAG: acetate--CoA ligase family protein [Deltaproteobacteria bacterium]|nr:acetate--CoA ligase family protein [Deltaproteobacteria bacterium]